MKKRRQTTAWYRRPWVWAAFVVVIAGLGAALLWPRTPAYAEYTDGVRPSVVFVWSDPTPHHPHG